VDHVITVINSLNGVFRLPKRIDSFDNSTIQVESLSATIVTTTLLNRNHIEDVLSNVVLSDTVLELKDTMSDEVLSILYKKVDQTQGITINIKDNPYKLNSSILSVFGTDSIEQLIIIAKQIAILDIVNNDKTEDVQQKIREKSHIKDLRKQGVEISSKKCQKDRQPSVSHNTNNAGHTYTLEFNSIKYVCPAKEYPYPGFTNDNIVCCFKKDQRNKPVYIRNTNASNYDVVIQPSNYKVKISNTNKTAFETYAIKVVSDYREGFNETNSMGRFYYIGNNNELIAITNEKLLQTLEELDDTNWLEEIPLATITSESPKNKCNFTPNLENRSDNDINSPCAHHAKNKIFAYNLNSYPCCFNKEPDYHLQLKKKKVVAKHIFTSDKILEHQRIGLLPDNLDNLFNKLVKHDSEYMFYRMGVLQNTSSFLNAITLALNDVPNLKEFRKTISDYIRQNPIVYTQLNSGNINLKYGKIDNYINYIMDVNETLYWEDLLDIVQRITKTNILILDIPYSNREANYNETKIICNQFQKIDKALPCIILIKRQNIFELVFQMKQSESHPDPIYLFSYNPLETIKDNIINFFVDYQTSSCVRQNNFPSDYKYQELFEIEPLINILTNTTHTIISQVMNKFKKVNYVITKRGILIPIKETGAIDSLKIVSLQQLRSKNKLWDLTNFIKGVDELNTLLPLPISILGVTTDLVDNVGMYTSALTNFGQFVPLKHTPIDKDDNVPILKHKFYENVDDILSTTSKVSDDLQKQYNKGIQDFKNVIYQIKTKLGDAISQNTDLKEQIININKNVSLSRNEKLHQLRDIFIDFVDTKDQTYDTDMILQHISNEILNDNVENLLLNNIVISDVFDPNSITQRDQETVILNIADMETWFAKYERK
jgi:hypothetical protein